CRSRAWQLAGCASSCPCASPLTARCVSQTTPPSMIKPVVAAIDMGYGHLRPAAALADHLATEVVQMDAPPVGSKRDRAFWAGIRKVYEPLTRMSQVGVAGAPMRELMNTLTAVTS